MQFMAQHQQLQEVVKTPVSLNILLALWRRDPLRLQRVASTSLAIVY